MQIQPIHYGVDYHDDPLEFKLVFGCDHPLDRYDMQSISMWLTGYQNYQWLSIDQPDLDGISFRCLITELHPISIGWLPVAFEATVRCDCPYAYSFPIEQTWEINDGQSIVFVNESTVRDYLYPYLQIITSDQSFKIINHSDNDRVMEFQNLPGGKITIDIDCARGIISGDNDGINLYECFNMNFFRLVPGDNVLEVIGSGEVSLSCRFMFNTAG